MRIDLIAVGRMRGTAEAGLVGEYLDRFGRSGRGLGLPAVNLVEVEDRKGGGMAAEARLIERALPPASCLVILDERGQMLASPEFARHLSGWRDTGRDVAFVIGGADGIDPALRAKADLAISFGKMVWPHMLVRVMLSEQIYRAATILAGSPYHRV